MELMQNKNVKKFSVVTVVLNDRAGFIKTKDSILQQSLGDWEWIVVDGLSIDGTVDEIEKCKEHIEYVFVEKDSGIYNAMNKGISVCKGMYIIFMNAGDMFSDSDALKRVDSVLKEKTDILIAGTIQKVRYDEIYRAPRNIEWIKYGMPSFHQSTFFSRESMSMELYDERYALLSDYAWVARKCVNGIKVVSFDSPVSVFSIGGRSYTNLKKKYEDSFHVKRDILRLSIISSNLISFFAVVSSYLVTNFPSLWLFSRRFLMRLKGANRPKFEAYSVNGKWEKGKFHRL